MADKLSPIQEQLLQRADSIFNSISTGVAKATNFASEQIPDIAIQYVAFGRAYYTAILMGCAIFVIAWALCMYKLVKANTNNEPQIIGTGIVGGIFSLISVLTSAENMKDFFLVWFAPKIWLITEIVKIVK